MSTTTSNPKTILFAGHDLKFVKHLIEHFEKRPGFNVLLDKTTRESVKNKSKSRKLLERADMIFCEWGLGNAVWYSQNKKPHQRLVVRMHRQEYETEYPNQFDYNAVDSVITIAPLWYDKFHERFPVPREKLKLIFNTVDIEAFSVAKTVASPFHLGIVGIVPQMKRFDIALDLIEKLYKIDSRYKLFIKGKLPHEYSWMLNKAREKEMKYYDDCYARINNSPWAGNVVFDPQGDDMPEWFSKIGFLLSPSDFEGSHHSIAESMAAGCLPVIRNWDGADLIYPKRFIHAGTKEMLEAVLRGTNPSTIQENREYARRHFDRRMICGQIETLLTTGQTPPPVRSDAPEKTSRSVGICTPISLNFIDGSSIWLRNFIKAHALRDNYSVNVLMRTDIKREIPVGSLLEHGNVKLVTPSELQKNGVVDKAVSPLPEMDLASAMLDMFTRYQLDYAILRGLGCSKILTGSEVLRNKLCIYPMEMTRSWFRSASPEDIERYRNVFDYCFAIVMQTEEMREYFLRYYPEHRTKITLLPPMVFDFNTAPWTPAKQLRLVYAGKFSEEWNTLSILSAVRNAHDRGVDVRLTCFGDKIHNDPTYPDFMPKMQSLLESGSPIHWMKAVPHEKVLAALGAFDLGIGWRHSSLNQSLEISTKLLEYCKAGLPAVVNPTEMHRRLFGDDYPFFADSEDDFLRLLSTIRTEDAEYRRAKDICTKVGKEHDTRKHLDRFFADIEYCFSKSQVKRNSTSHNRAG